MTKHVLLLAVLLLLPAQAATADAPPRYHLTELPLDFYGYNPVDRGSAQGGINAQGQIAGSFGVRSGALLDGRVALWEEGRPLRILDKRPVTRENTPSDRDFLYPTAVNARGEVTGVETTSSSGAYTVLTSNACILWKGRLNRLYRFPSRGDTNSIALGLNDRDEVVGGFVYNNNASPSQDDTYIHPDLYRRHAFLRRGGRIKVLWPGVARGINNREWIVGVWGDDEMNWWRDRGVLWRGGHVTFLKMQPVAINGRGWVAGSAYASEDKSRAYLWKNGRLVPLTRQLSKAYALNLRGDVVGKQEDPASSHSPRAVLWRRGRTYDLNRCVVRPQGWVLDWAAGVNDKGWVIGTGSVYKSPTDKTPTKAFTFLLTPR